MLVEAAGVEPCKDARLRVRRLVKLPFARSHVRISYAVFGARNRRDRLYVPRGFRCRNLLLRNSAFSSSGASTRKRSMKYCRWTRLCPPCCAARATLADRCSSRLAFLCLASPASFLLSQAAILPVTQRERRKPAALQQREPVAAGWPAGRRTSQPVASCF